MDRAPPAGQHEDREPDLIYGPLEWEDAVYNEQEEWIKSHCSSYAADHANYGWATDYVHMQISTKVYGYGILTTNVRLNHMFQET